MKNNTLTVSDEVKRRALPWALASGAFNAVFALWVFSGSVFVLFMRELGLPASEIGGLLSLFPFCGLLALLTSFLPLFICDHLGMKAKMVMRLVANPLATVKKNKKFEQLSS